MSSRPVARRRKRYSGSSSGAGDGAAHEDLGAYAAVAALVRARCMAAESQESQESTEMDMVPGPEVVRMSFGFWALGCAGGEESSLGSLKRFVSNASNGARVSWAFSEVLELRARKVGVGV
eukprot:scaffold22463_cov149-Isochrysis_galbana.AAC.2